MIVFAALSMWFVVGSVEQIDLKKTKPELTPLSA
jgi:hypothetical protein